jgi:allantoin racemase
MKESNMQTKIFWLVDNLVERIARNEEEQEVVFGGLRRFAKSVARPDTEFVLNPLTRTMGRYSQATFKYDRAMIAVEVLERVKQAEQDGFDAAFPGQCFGEFFLQEARQAVSIPVTGPAESSMTIAQLLGHKFGVVTVAPNYVNGIEQNIRAHGWQERAVSNRPVRYWVPDYMRLTFDAFNGNPDELIEEFEKEALKSIEDGADVIIFGCNPMAAALANAGYNEVGNTGVPVIAPLAAQIKLAESMVDLRRALGITKSEAVLGPYQSTPESILKDMSERKIGLPDVRQPGESYRQAYGSDGQELAALAL